MIMEPRRDPSYPGLLKQCIALSSNFLFQSSVLNDEDDDGEETSGAMARPSLSSRSIASTSSGATKKKSGTQKMATEDLDWFRISDTKSWLIYQHYRFSHEIERAMLNASEHTSLISLASIYKCERAHFFTMKLADESNFLHVMHGGGTTHVYGDTQTRDEWECPCWLSNLHEMQIERNLLIMIAHLTWFT